MPPKPFWYVLFLGRFVPLLGQRSKKVQNITGGQKGPKKSGDALNHRAYTL